MYVCIAMCNHLTSVWCVVGLEVGVVDVENGHAGSPGLDSSSEKWLNSLFTFTKLRPKILNSTATYAY